MGKSTEKFLEQNYLITVISGRYAALENKAEFLRLTDENNCKFTALDPTSNFKQYS